MTDRAEIAAALDENEQAPHGPVRSARAQHLVELAGEAGDRPLLIRALQELINAHEFDGHSEKILVPFARVLRMWDEDPSDFDERAMYGLHWHFKWVTSGMLWQPDVPLASIHRWLGEMENRYRQAGYGMHAVYLCQFTVAEHVGDVEAAQRAFDAWTSSARDRISDCPACELSNKGDWLVTTGRDREALDAWQPVLDGRLRCAEEPHRVLAKSLLPLVRLGRLDEARASHLRGYRLVRGTSNLRGSVGYHLEFMALTGNEALGLEMLAQHASWLTADGAELGGQLQFLQGAAVLLRRLRVLGHADLPISTPRAATPTTTIDELLPVIEDEIQQIGQRFDARNGSTAVSGHSRARLDRAPLVDSLPLGAKASARIAARRNPPTAAPAGAPVEPVDLQAQARELTERHHPGAHAAWQRVAASGTSLPAGIQARIAEHRVLAATNHDPAAVRDGFLGAAAAYQAAGEPDGAVVNRARAALAAARVGDAAAGDGAMAAALREVTELRAAGRATDTDYLLVRLCAAGAALAVAEPEAVSPEAAGLAQVPAAFEADVREIVALAGEYGLPYRAGGAWMLLARAAVGAGEHERVPDLLDNAVREYLAADVPWEAAAALTMRGELAARHGDLAGAERYLRDAERHGGDLLDKGLAGHLESLLAEVYLRQGGHDAEVVEYALRAAARLDGHAPLDAARARLLAGMAFHRGDRHAEAAGVLEAALDDIEEHGGEGDQVQVQRLYGLSLAGLGEYRESARALLRAAGIAAGWPDQTTHALLAHDAAGSLEHAGLVDEAERAYARAGLLWRDLHRTGAYVRSTRARAWLAVRHDEPDWAAARALMEQAAADLDRADASTDGDADEIEYQRWETQVQLAHLYRDWPRGEPAQHQPATPEESIVLGLSAAEAAANGFAAIGEKTRAVRAQLDAAQFEAWLGRPREALARVLRLREQCDQRGDTELVKRCDQYLQWLGSNSTAG